MKKAKLRLTAYGLIEDAVEKGIGFALNRLEDTWDQTIPDPVRDEAKPKMLHEIMNYLSEVIDWEKSG